MDADPKGYAWRHRRKELMDAIKTTLPKPATKKLLCPKCRRNSPAHTFKDRRCLACQVGAWLATP